MKELSRGDTAWQIAEFMASPWHTSYLQLWSQQPGLREGDVAGKFETIFYHAAAEKNIDLSSLLFSPLDA